MTRKKLNLLTTILGVIAALLGAALPFTITRAPLAVLHLHLGAIGIMMGLVIILSVVRLLMSKSWISKLAALPVLAAIVMTGLMLYYSGVYDFILAAGGHKELSAEATNTDMIFTLMPMMHIVIWGSVIPVFIAALLTMRKSTKEVPKDFSHYIRGYGRIVSVEPTDIRINRQRVFLVTAEIQTHLHDVYIGKREMVIGPINYKLLTPHERVDFLVHENKPKDFYIEIDGEVY